MRGLLPVGVIAAIGCDRSIVSRLANAPMLNGREFPGSLHNLYLQECTPCTSKQNLKEESQLIFDFGLSTDSEPKRQAYINGYAKYSRITKEQFLRSRTIVFCGSGPWLMYAADMCEHVKIHATTLAAVWKDLFQFPKTVSTPTLLEALKNKGSQRFCDQSSIVMQSAATQNFWNKL